MTRRLLRIAGPLFGIALFSVAVAVLVRECRHYGLHQILASLQNIPIAHLALGVVFSGLCYLALTGYDAIAWRHIGLRLPYRRIAVASFVGYAFSHNMGFALLTGAPVKYRIYSAWGLRALDVAKVVAFSGFTIIVGISTLLGLVLLLEPQVIPAFLHLPPSSGQLLGALLLFFVAGYVILSLLRTRPFRLLKRQLSVPAPSVSLGQILVSCSEWIFAAAALYILFEPQLPISYPAFLGIFLVAYVAGFASQVPGGLGVFDTLILLSLEPIMPTPTILAALLAYRGVFYILPLITATTLLGMHEIARRTRPAEEPSS